MDIINHINELSKDLSLVNTYQDFGKVFHKGLNDLQPGIDQALFYNFDWHEKQFELYSALGYEEDDIPHYATVEKMLRELFDESRSVFDQNIGEKSPLKLFNKTAKTGSAACLPIRPFNDPAGILFVYSKQINYFDKTAVDTCNLISGMASRAIKRHSLQRHQIKQSKSAEKRYISQKNLMSEILNYLPVNIYMKDGRGRYIFINKQGEDIIQQYDGEGLGKTDYELFPKEQADRSRITDSEIRKNKKPITVQEEMTFDGSVHHMFTSKKLVKTTDNQELILGFSFDITDNINIQKDLEEQKRLIQQVLDTSPNFIYVKDKDGNYLLINQTMADLFKTTKEDILNTPYKSNKFKFDAYEQSHQSDLEVINTLKTVELEEKITLPGEEPRWYLTTKVPFPDKEGDINVLCISVDITSQKKNADELFKAQKAKEQFLANMSHEIRTPINGIIGMISLLEATQITPEQEKYLSSIKSSSQNLRGIITEILDFSLIESGKIKINNVPFRPRKLFDDTIYSFERTVEEKGLKFICYFDENINSVLKGDPLRLNQIIINLVSNAIKFTTAGYIKLFMESLGIADGRQTLQIVIEDSGMGIPRNKTHLVFESFKQADESINRKFGGTGLGLAICKELAELQNGSIELQSDEGKGSTFTVTIPYELSNEGDLHESGDVLGVKKAELDKIDFEKLDVLLVEDNEINVLYAKTVLQKFNCNVDTAENGKIAIEKILKNDYKLILMDLQMPEMDGYKATQIIRNELPVPKNNLPVIAVTANAIKGEREKCLAVGMNDYIAKPFEPKTLENVLLKYYKPKLSEKEMVKTLVNSANKETKKLVDLTYLGKISDNDKAFMKEMIETFIKNAPEDIKLLKSLLKEKKLEKMAGTAHKLKPAIKFMGIKPAIENILKIEDFAKKESNLQQLPRLIYQLENDCLQAIEELKEIIAADFSGMLQT